MTLGGIAAAIGLVIDDAIVVVEAIYAKIVSGLPRLEAVQTAMGEIILPLIGSTLTPVVVFIPLAFFDGITGVFFRSLGISERVEKRLEFVQIRLEVLTVICPTANGTIVNRVDHISVGGRTHRFGAGVFVKFQDLRIP
jgi:hypothetical protein